MEARACGYPDEACSTCEADTVPDDCLTGFGPPECSFEACCAAHGVAEDVGVGGGTRDDAADTDTDTDTDTGDDREYGRVRLTELRIRPGRRCCRTDGCGPGCW